MLFSVVTVCLNPGKDLDATVDSVAMQDFDRYEHIIKDGGSDDGTRSRTWKNPRIRFSSAPDNGIYDAMNQALDLCMGKYILFLNAGDRFTRRDILSRLAAHCSRQDSASVVYCDYYNEEYEFAIRYPDRLSPGFLFRKTLCHQVTLVERSCIERFGGFDSDFRVLADYELLLRMLLHHRLPSHHVPVVGVRYMGSGLSASPRMDKKKRLESARIRKRYFSLPQRLVFGMLWHATMPRLRVWMVRRCRNRLFRKVYSWMANLLVSSQIETIDASSLDAVRRTGSSQDSI